jgi:hypothetical protein
MTISRTMLAALAALTLGGCQTVFTGAARVERGPLGCREQCQAWDMVLAGMVKMGEYSDGCICQVRPASPPASSVQQPSSQAPGIAPQSFAAAAGGAVAGVWMQTQAAEQARQEQAAEQARQEQAAEQAHQQQGAQPHGAQPRGTTGVGRGWR